MSSLISFLKQVKDWRNSSGKRHPVWWVLLIVIHGVMMGNLNYRDLAAFGKHNHDYFVDLAKSPHLNPPSYSTIRRVMMGVNNDDLIERFNQWATQLSSEENFPNWVAIDGKTIKSTLTYHEWKSTELCFYCVLVFSRNWTRFSSGKVRE